jgi:AraC-like DNA-binding protein
LRLAHRLTVGAGASERARPRSISDFELLLQITGASWIWWEPLQGSVALPAGSVALIPPGPVHGWGETVGTHIAVHFDLEAQTDLEPMAMLHYLEGSVERSSPVDPPWLSVQGSGAPLTLPLVTRLQNANLWRKRLDQLVHLYQTRRHRELTAQMCFLEVIGWALSSLTEQARPSKEDADSPDRRVDTVLAAIAAGSIEYNAPVSELARCAGMSESAFRRSFERVTDLSPRRYLEGLRMEQAARWLVETERPIEQVARSVGYTDPFHFSRAFKRATGLSPRAYRQRSLT